MMPKNYNLNFMCFYIKMVEIADFLPKYPFNDIKNVNPLQPYGPEHFNQVIYNKKEFNELKLDGREAVLHEQGELMKHQKIISRFLNHSPYNGILLFHAPGTGKTCASLGAAEAILNNKYNNINRVLILTKGDKSHNIFASEFVGKCIKQKYNIDSSDPKVVQKKLRPIYTFDTFMKFSDKIARMTSDAIRGAYSNYVVIIDEVHNLRPKKHEKGTRAIYNNLYRFLHKYD